MIQTDRVLNIIRGKNLVGAATKEDINLLFEHLDAIEIALAEADSELDAIEIALDEADSEDMFGTEGWRHRLGMED
jgi:hypothetical protein